MSKTIAVSVERMVYIMSELQQRSQNGLTQFTGIPHSNLSAIENDKVNLGVERAKVLASALNCHPAVLAGKRLKQLSVLNIGFNFHTKSLNSSGVSPSMFADY